MYGFTPYSTLPYSDISIGAANIEVRPSGVPLVVALGLLGAGAGARFTITAPPALVVDLNIVQVHGSAVFALTGVPLILGLEGVTTSTSNRVPVEGFNLIVSNEFVTVEADAHVSIFGVEVHVFITAPIVWSPATEDVDTPWTPIVLVPDCDMWAPIENEPDCDWAPIENEPDCDMWAPIENEPDCEKWAEVQT